MLHEVIEIIKETFSPSIEVTGDTAIKTDLELDSLEIVSLICMLENKFEIQINELEIVSLVTVNDICEYIAANRIK